MNTRNDGQVEPKLLISGSSGKTYAGFLGWWQVVRQTNKTIPSYELSGNWYVRYLDVRQVVWTTFFKCNCLFAFEKNLSLRHQKKTPSLVLSTPSVTWTEKQKVFKKWRMSSEYRILLRDYSWKIISI